MNNNMAHPRIFSEIKTFKFDEEQHCTTTSKEQIATETAIERCFDRFEQFAASDPTLPTLARSAHIDYLQRALRYLSTGYECLDSSRPWLVYWILNSASLLGLRFDDETLSQVVDFLARCRDSAGGFGGGPGQVPHLAPTYAAVNSLVTIGTEAAYKTIDKRSLKQFFLAVREPNGAFRMHLGGEVDVRGAYCAVSCSKLINFSAAEEREMFKDTGLWIASCQTYEGGFGGAPGLEAHGGYSFCAAATLAMLGTGTDMVDLHALLRWAVNRQMRYEGGFQGRTNKLVDGCYSFWQGALVPVAQALLSKSEPAQVQELKAALFNREALQEYVLICCQTASGGLIDKPGKPADPYHTCYTLSGLSVAQHCDHGLEPLVLGDPANEVLPTHPIHNIPPKCALMAYMYFLQHENGQNGWKAEAKADEEKNNQDAAEAVDESGSSRMSSRDSEERPMSVSEETEY